jgi:hypothetical protein
MGLDKIDILWIATRTGHHHVILLLIVRPEKMIIPFTDHPEFIICGSQVDLANLFSTVDDGMDLKPHGHHGINLLKVQRHGIGFQVPGPATFSQVFFLEIDE